MGMITRNVIIELIIIITLVPMMNETEIQTLCDLGFYEYCEPEFVWAGSNTTRLNQTTPSPPIINCDTSGERPYHCPGWALSSESENETSMGSCPNQTGARDLMARSWCDFLH
jgi:hypothetical protein